VKEFLKNLNLSPEAIEIYLNILDKSPLTFSEIYSIKSDLPKKKLIEILNELLQSKLLINISADNPIIVGHFMAIPPIYEISKMLNDIRCDLIGKEGKKSKIELVLDEIFEHQNKIELENIYKDFKILLDNINRDTDTIKKELDELLDQIEKKVEEPDFIDKCEQEIKNKINSQLSSIVITILQLKAEFKDKLDKLGISANQWDTLKDEIKNILTSGIHEKSKELSDIVSNEFNEVKKTLEETYTDLLKDRFEQKSIHLGILNIFKNDLDKFHKALLLKKNNISLDLTALKNLINTEATNTIANINEINLNRIQLLETLFIEFFNIYNNKFTINLDSIWPVSSIANVNDEIINLLKKSQKNLIMVVTNLKDFTALKELENFSNDVKIHVISSDSHKSEIVNSIKKNKNLEYKRLKENDFIGLCSDGTYLIFGFASNSETTQLKNIIGFGTNNKHLIDLLVPILNEKIELARFPREVRINMGFNYIIENINEIKGKKISKILQETLDFAFKKKGISLNLLEIKVLISKLKAINKPLDKDMKIHVVEKIQEFNKQFTSLELIIPPKLSDLISKEPIIEEKSVISGNEILKLKTSFPDSADYEKINGIFELFLEKLGTLKGKDISEQLDKIIDIIINFQGYSNIIEWRDNLASIEDHLQETFQNKLIEDLKNWKVKLMEPSIMKTEILNQENSDQMDISLGQINKISSISGEQFESVKESGDSEKSTSTKILEPSSIESMFSKIDQEINVLTGSNISKLLQKITDIILETKGYAVGLKDMRQWISKLKRINTPLEDEIKNSLKEKIDDWKKEAL
jgi:hypothetical protein